MPVMTVPRFDETAQWESDDTHNFAAERFVIYRAQLQFACGEWDVDERLTSGKTAVQRRPDGIWEDVPPVVLPLEAQDSIYRFVGVATGAEGMATEIEARQKQCSLCPRTIDPGSPDACLVGEWHLASGGLGAKIGEMLEASPGLANVDYPDLDNVLIFNDDGSYVARTEDDGRLESVKPSGDRIIGDVSLDFETMGTWSVNGNRLEQCSAPPDLKIDLDMIDTSNGTTGRIRADDYLGPRSEIRTSRQFTCADGTLNLTEGGFFAPRIEWVYRKE